MSDTRTMPTCPPWCALPDGHPWESDSDGMCRGHVRQFYGDDPTLNIGQAIQVTIDSWETLDNGGVVDTHGNAVTMGLYADGGALDGPTARKVAAALLDAADAWDAVQAGS